MEKGRLLGRPFSVARLLALADDSHTGACYNGIVGSAVLGGRSTMDTMAGLWVIGLVVIFFGLSLIRA